VTRHNRCYYVYWLNHRSHEGRRDWYERHPASLWIQQDYLFAAVKKFFANRVFGPRRSDLLAQQLGDLATHEDDRTIQRGAILNEELDDLRRRRANLVSQLEEDDGSDREFRTCIQTRFKELGTRLKTLQDEIVLLEAGVASKGGNDPILVARNLVLPTGFEPALPP
jgi:site-specific DNA recombinase